MFSINELYKYSWFADSAYIKWVPRTLTNQVEAVVDAIKAEKLPERDLSTDPNDVLPSGKGLATHVFHPDNEGWRILDYVPNDPVGYSGTLFGNGNELVFGIRGTEPEGMQAWVDLREADLHQIGYYGVAIDQLVSLVNQVLRLKAPKGASGVARIEYHVDISAPESENFLREFSAHTDTVSKYHWFEVRYDAIGTGGLENGQTATVTGHSLGGHLAAFAARLFPGSFPNAVTFNAPGYDAAVGFGTHIDLLLHPGLKWSDEFVELFAKSGIVEPAVAFDTNAIYTVESENTAPGDDGEGVSSDLTGKPFSPEIYIATENNSHSMEQLVDALAIQSLLELLLPGGAQPAQSIGIISSIVKAISRIPGDSQEVLVEKLSKLFLDDTTTLPRGEAGALLIYSAPFDSRVPLHERILKLMEYVSGKPTLRLQSLLGMNATDLANSARSEIAYRYALVHLNPFVIAGENSLYEIHNREGELNLYDSVEKVGVTGEYLSARAKMLLDQLALNVNDEPIRPGLPFPSGYDQPYADAAQQTGDQEIGAVLDLHYTEDHKEQRLFGASGSDRLIGSTAADMLFGGKGDDELNGKGGADYLEGGEGDDTYIADDGDTIFDHDGFGRVLFAGEVLYGGTRTGGSGAYTDMAGHLYLFDGDDLVVIRNGQSLTIKHFTNLDLGIDLEDDEQTSGVPGASLVEGTHLDDVLTLDAANRVYIGAGGILGVDDALNAIAFPGGISAVSGNAGADTLIVNVIGEYENIRLSGGQGNDVIHADNLEAFAFYHQNGPLPTSNAGALVDGGADDDRLHGSLRRDEILGGTGHDYAEGYHGEDALDGGDGNDWLAGGAGKDRLRGEDGSDRLLGGAGDDRLFGSGGDDRLYGDADTGYGEWRGAVEAVAPIPGVDYAFVPGATPPYEYAFIQDVAPAAAGDDLLDGGEGKDYLFGGGGDDDLYGGDDTDVLAGEGGDDYLVGGKGSDTLFGDKSADQLAIDAEVILTLDYPSGQALFHAREYRDSADVSGDDRLFGGDGHDTLWGNAGDDELYGGGDGDTILGGEGNDLLNGGTGGDHLIGGPGDDRYVFNAGWGYDVIYEESGRDEIRFAAGLTGDDIAIHRLGDDLAFLDTTTGSNLIVSGWYTQPDAGIETVIFADGRRLDSDAIHAATLHQQGGDRRDVLAGYAGEANTLSGGGGDDRLTGANLADRLFGGDGNDTLEGGGGDDRLDGGLGSDRYLLGTANGQVVIHDTPVDGMINTLSLAPGLLPGTVEAELVGDDLVMRWHDGASGVTVQGYASAPETWRLEAASGNELAVAALLDPPVPGRLPVQAEWELFRETTYAAMYADAALQPRPVTGSISATPRSHYIPVMPSLEELQAAGVSAADAVQSWFTAHLNATSGWSFYAAGLGIRHVDAIDTVTITGTDGPDHLEPGEDVAYATVERPVYLTLQATERHDNGSYTAQIVASSYSRPAHVPEGELTTRIDTYGNLLRAAIPVQTERRRLPTLVGGSGDDHLGSSVFVGSGLAATYHPGTLSSSRYFRYPLMIDGGVGDDELFGGRSGDFLIGGAGDDELLGYAGDDVLVAGAGDDRLFGHAGSDRYRIDFSTAGHDRIEDNGLFLNGDVAQLSELLPGVSYVDLPALFTAADQAFAEQLLSEFVDLFEPAVDAVSVNADLADVTLAWAAPDADQRLGIVIHSMSNPAASVEVRLRGPDDFYGFGIERFEFTDVTLTLADLTALLPTLPDAWPILGSTDADELSGSPDDDVLGGGQGEDLLAGGAGDDVYLYNPGDGYDVIVDDGGESLRSGTDTLSFGVGIRPEAVAAALRDDRERPGPGTRQTLFLWTPSNPGDVVEIEWTYGVDDPDYVYPEDTRIERVQFVTPSGARVFDLQGLIAASADALSAAYTSEAVVYPFTPEVLDAFEVTATAAGPDGGQFAVSYAVNGAVDREPRHLPGGPGEDSLQGTDAGDRIDGGAGNDNLAGGDGHDLLIGGAGYDRLDGGAGDDVFLVEGQGAGVDIVSGGQGTDTLLGTPGDDTFGLYLFDAANGVEYIDGGGGVNTLAGSGSVDWLDFSATTLVNIDRIEAGDGGDTVIGSSGNDTLVGGGGDDVFIVEGRDHEMDAFDGGPGEDKIVGGAGDDIIGVYRFDPSHSIECIDGGTGSNMLMGSVYRDVLDFSATRLAHIDRIDAGGGNDSVTGSAGDDTIDGGQGDDRLHGGAGDDTYVFGRGHGEDRVRESGAGSAGDQAVWGAVPVELAFARNGQDLEVSTLGASDRVIIEHWYDDDPDAQIERFVADGNALENTQIELLIQAMATFTADQGAANWEQAVANDQEAATTLVATFWQAEY